MKRVLVPALVVSIAGCAGSPAIPDRDAVGHARLSVTSFSPETSRVSFPSVIDKGTGGRRDVHSSVHERVSERINQYSHLTMRPFPCAGVIVPGFADIEPVITAELTGVWAEWVPIEGRALRVYQLRLQPTHNRRPE